MEESAHHTEKQIAAAFSYAPKVLKRLRDAGCKLVSLELFSDASGTLHFNMRDGDLSDELVELGAELVRSQRFNWSENSLCIDFCCGLVLAAEDSKG